MVYKHTRVTTRWIVLLFIIIILVPSCSTSSFFYAPNTELKYYPDTSIYTVEDIYLTNKEQKKLHGRMIKPKSQKVIGTILQLHGNAGNISYQYQFTEPMITAGFQAVVFDYQGFGKSEGKASQENVLSDAILMLNYIKTRPDVQQTKTILFGQSLGGHLACVVAAKEQHLIDALVIEGAFSGHEEIAYDIASKKGAPKWLTNLLVPSKYDAIDYINLVTVPKLIIHSKDDATCPYYMGESLYKTAVDPKTFWAIDGYHLQGSVLYPEEFVKKFKKLIE